MNRQLLKNIIARTNPELSPYLEQQDTNTLLKQLLVELNQERSLNVKGISMMKGETGNDGYTPIKGEDYFTEEDIQFIVNRIKTIILTEGTDFISPEEVDERIETAIDNIPQPDTLSPEEIQVFVEDKIQKISKAKEETPKTLITKLNTLKGAIDPSVIKGIVTTKDLESTAKKIEDGMALVDGRVKAIDLRWRGGGLARVTTDATLSGSGTVASPLSVIGSGTNVETPTGTVNGVNSTFTVTHTPVFIYVDRLPKFSQLGDFSYAAGTITILDGAPPVQNIISIY